MGPRLAPCPPVLEDDESVLVGDAPLGACVFMSLCGWMLCASSNGETGESRRATVAPPRALWYVHGHVLFVKPTSLACIGRLEVRERVPVSVYERMNMLLDKMGKLPIVGQVGQVEARIFSSSLFVRRVLCVRVGTSRKNQDVTRQQQRDSVSLDALAATAAAK